MKKFLLSVSFATLLIGASAAVAPASANVHHHYRHHHRHFTYLYEPTPYIGAYDDSYDPYWDEPSLGFGFGLGFGGGNYYGGGPNYGGPFAGSDHHGDRHR